ncbi:ABC transporter substrate-binding protein [Actinoplanes lobatus]|uniref:ABC transporter substrate-binding protein n=1 Tax=Actinoplanes lobatus TaxID=113568 RepID=A0A7W7HDC2_9ACTN|nr:sugar ABC transporter substrate-binding protein [Actinoplanes lobatus]MBB4748027.1 multiple sugar transport system substrate-binding protein [Actinoplanes lobatus]GGN80732.1 ABC transporter substrate-binding protein [Actinoplanes lobatus]GIE41506.1 ABC transporter substrate-binding protein [Actinoplanes lobatus]
MRTRQRLSLLTVAAMIGVTGCSQGTESTESTAEQNVAATTSCAANGELTMWERSGGNKDMVDMLVAAWNTKNPDCKIALTYIPHTEMVGKIAQGIASGQVPDLMGMDLIYAPQFEKAGQLVDLTDRIRAWPELATASSGHMTVATYDQRLYGVPLYADVSALFYNKDLFKKAGLDPAKPPASLSELRSYADRITALGGDVKGYYLPGNCAGCNIFTVGPLMWASGAKIEAAGPGDEPLVGDGVKQVLQFERDMVKAGNVHDGDRTENGETFHLQFGSGKVGMMGTGNFNITLARQQNPGMDFGIALLPGVAPNSSASFIGGDLVVVPKGSKRVNDAVNFMKFLLSDDVQVEVYAKALNLTTRSDMVDNKYFQAEPLVQDVAKALTVGRTPYTLTFFEQINSPQGPWLKMLQRAYYSDDDLDTVIADAKKEMKEIAAKS